MKTFITKLRLSTHPVGKQDKPIKVVWDGVDLSNIVVARPWEDIDMSSITVQNTWGEPVEYVVSSGSNTYANVISHDPYIIGASFQNVSQALAQASSTANELQQAVTRLADISYIDNEVLASIRSNATTSRLTTTEVIENLINDRLRGNI